MKETPLPAVLAVARGLTLFSERPQQLLMNMSIRNNEFWDLDQRLFGVGNPTVVKAVFA